MVISDIMRDLLDTVEVAKLAEAFYDKDSVKPGDEFYFVGYSSSGKYSTSGAKKVKVEKVTTDKDHPVQFVGGMACSFECLSSAFVPVKE